MEFRAQHPLRFHDLRPDDSPNKYDPKATQSKIMMGPMGKKRNVASKTLEAVGDKKSLKEILEQNNLYDEVLSQINTRLAMRESAKSGHFPKPASDRASHYS